MTIPYCIQVGDRLTDCQITEIKSTITQTFAEIHQIYNNWNPDSEISQLNRLEAYQKVSLSPQLAAFLKRIDSFVSQTEGRFDPTVEPLYQLWKQALQSGTLPEPDKIAHCSAAVGWRLIHLKENLFWKEHPKTALDLGGVAKGYGVDLLAERLEKLGYGKIYVEWGGEIRTIGNHPKSRPWKIAILGLSTIDLSDSAIATSGSYVQNWSVEGTCYTHIIDPRTCQPLHNAAITSVSVISSTCCEADALATALMLFPSEQEALEWGEAMNIQLFTVSG